jgi:hypothetical protein
MNAELKAQIETHMRADGSYETFLIRPREPVEGEKRFQLGDVVQLKAKPSSNQVMQKMLATPRLAVVTNIFQVNSSKWCPAHYCYDVTLESGKRLGLTDERNEDVFEIEKVEAVVSLPSYVTFTDSTLKPRPSKLSLAPLNFFAKAMLS